MTLQGEGGFVFYTSGLGVAADTTNSLGMPLVKRAIY